MPLIYRPKQLNKNNQSDRNLGVPTVCFYAEGAQ